MKKGLFLTGAFAVSAMYPGGAAAGTGSQDENLDLPNVVVFLVDDMGWMDSSCYGSRFYRTPNMEALAESGLMFTDAYSACTVSSPTRAALMTGKYPARLHLTDFIAGHNFAWARMSPPDWRKYLPLEEVTIAEILKDAGYATWHVGKWHLGQEEKYYPQNQGFDINIGGCGMGAPGQPGPRTKGYFSPYGVQYNLAPGPEGEYLTDRLTDEALRLIRGRDRSKPFYLNMAHYAVHTPLQAKQDKISKYEALADSSYFQKNAVYAAMIESMDESLGRIRAELEKEGIADNTLFIFASDNGALYSVSESHPLRAGKGSEFEGGIRTPLIISWPGHIEPGTVSHEPVITMDIPATLMDMVGYRPEGALDGKSLMPVFEGRKLKKRPLFWHYPHYHFAKPFSSMRLGDWKLIEMLEDNSLMLFNLKNDIGETENLAGKYPKRTAEMYAMLSAWRDSVDAQYPVPNPDYDPARADKKAPKGRKQPDRKISSAILPVTPPTERYTLDTAAVPSAVYRKDPDLKLYFMYPENLGRNELRPAIVFFFGGGWVSGSVNAFAMQAKALSERGMVAVLADYRTKNRYGTPPTACVEDARSAMRYLKIHAAEHHIDTTMLAAGGGSAGAHIAAATAFVKGFDSPDDDLSVSPVPKALVLFNPVFNNAPAPEGWGYERVRDCFPEISPAHNIAPGAPPVLILLGTNDKNVPVSTAEAFKAEMEKCGSRCDLELYEGAEHGFFHFSPKRTGDKDFYTRTLTRTIEFLFSLGYIKN